MADPAACDPAFVGALAVTLPKPNRSVPTASRPEILSISILLAETSETTVVRRVAVDTAWRG